MHTHTHTHTNTYTRLRSVQAPGSRALAIPVLRW